MLFRIFSHIQTECEEYFVEYCQSQISIVMELNDVMVIYIDQYEIS